MERDSIKCHPSEEIDLHVVFTSIDWSCTNWISSYAPQSSFSCPDSFVPAVIPSSWPSPPIGPGTSADHSATAGPVPPPCAALSPALSG